MYYPDLRIVPSKQLSKEKISGIQRYQLMILKIVRVGNSQPMQTKSVRF